MEAGAVVKAWGLDPCQATDRISRSKSRASVRCGVRAATPTATRISAAMSCCVSWPTTRAQELIDGVLDVVAPAQAAASVDRRRRAARAVPRARGAAAAAHGAWACTSQVVHERRCGRFPTSWATMRGLARSSCSIDGLQPRARRARAPATYERILKHIKGQHITVHCTITRQQSRAGYLTEFTRVLGARCPTCKRIWFSLYTPQKGENSAEMLRPRGSRSASSSEITDSSARAEAARHDSDRSCRAT